MKKLLALLLSVAMVASMFVGVAFATAPSAFLNARVTGVVAMGSTIHIDGTVLAVTPPTTMPPAIRHVVLQIRRTPGVGAWEVHTVLASGPTAGATLAISTTIPPIAVLLQHAGEYRIALTDTGTVAGVDQRTIALNRLGATPTLAEPALVHHIGIVRPGALVITPGVRAVTWSLGTPAVLPFVVVPLTITRVVAGVTEHVVPVSAAPTDAQALVTVSFAGQPIPAANVVFAGVGPLLRVTITHPLVVPPDDLSLVIHARTGDGNFEGTATVRVAPRAAFNARFTPNVVPAVANPATTVTYTVDVFSAAGLGAGAPPLRKFAYARATLTGPFVVAPAAIVITPDSLNDGRTGSFAAATVREGGPITATVEFFDADHNVLHTITEVVYTVAGWRLALPSPSVRLGPAVLRAIVTDAAGVRVPNARVVFESVGGVARFSRRTDAPGAFETAVTTRLEINGMLAVQPPGSTIVAGEYAIEAFMREPGIPAINVRVYAPIHVDPVTHIVTWELRANWIGAMNVLPAVGYTVTLASPHTLLAGADRADEVLVRVVATATGAPVTDGVWFTVPGAAGLFVHIGDGVYRIPMLTTTAGAHTVRAINAATRATGTIEGETTITAVAPLVTVTPAGGLLTANFYDVIRVTVMDPRPTIPVPVARRITVAPRTVTTPRHTAAVPDVVPTASIVASSSRPVATPVIPWPARIPMAPADVISFVQEFELLAHPREPRLLSIRGVVQTPNVRVDVAGAPAVDLVFGAATLVATPAELPLGRASTVTVRLNDARGTAMTGRNIRFGGLIPPVEWLWWFGASPVHTIPDGGTLSVTVIPRFPERGVMPPSHIDMEAITDRGTTVLIGGIPHPIAPIRTRIAVLPGIVDTVLPVIAHNAPATTTLESVLVTFTVTDNVEVARVIVGGTNIDVIPASTQSVVRTLPLAVGANTFVVQAADTAGNMATVTVTITRTLPPVERVLPIIEVTAPSITTDATATITIVARDNVAVTGLIFEGASVAVFPSPTVTVLRTVPLREGLNSFTLSATDAAGNVATRIIVIERRPPIVITIGRANPGIGLDVPADVRHGRLMVPFRWFAERVLNATVEFRVVGAAEIVTLRRGIMTVELTLGSTIVKVNGVPVTLDVAPFATGGRTLVPARFLAETFGYIVTWDSVTDEVTFTPKP